MDEISDNPTWHFYHTVEVRFADIDMFGHVNNAKYLTYIESARVAHYTTVTGITEPRDFDMTVASARLDFHKPAFYGQLLKVYTRISRIGNKSWTLEHEIRDASTEDLICSGSTVNVFYDYKSGKSQPVPPEIIAKMESFEQRTLRAM